MMDSLLTSWRHFLTLMEIPFTVDESLSTKELSLIYLDNTEALDSDKKVALALSYNDSNEVLVELKDIIDEGYIIFQASGLAHHLLGTNRLVSYLSTEYYEPILKEITRNMQLLQVSHSFMTCSNKECNSICITYDNNEGAKCPRCRIGGRLETTEQSNVVNKLIDSIATSFITDNQISKFADLPDLEHVIIMLEHQRLSQEEGFILDETKRTYTPSFEDIAKNNSMSVSEVRDITKYLVKHEYLYKSNTALFRKQQYYILRDKSYPRYRVSEAKKAFMLFSFNPKLKSLK
ncbi:hypothetical protein [Staphylococcus phage vB_SsapH-Golestan-100]|nr:hypothetical protein [Staphylococcus phage vB_SsapH-Golestan-100]